MTCSFVLQHACCAENMLNFIMSACQQLSTGYVVTVRARADSATSSVRFSVGSILSSTCPSTERAVKTLSFGELRIRESSQTNLIWRIPITRRSWGTAEQLSFLCAKCARCHVYRWKIKHLVFMEEVWRYTAPKPDYLADEYKCHHLYSTQVRDPPLSTTWWTLTIYWDQQLYSDAQ